MTAKPLSVEREMTKSDAAPLKEDEDGLLLELEDVVEERLELLLDVVEAEVAVLDPELWKVIYC